MEFEYQRQSLIFDNLQINYAIEMSKENGIHGIHLYTQ